MLLNKTLIGHLEYIENNISNLGLEKFSHHYQLLMDNQYIKVIYLTQFSHDCLYQFLVANQLSNIQNELPNYISIKVI